MYAVQSFTVYFVVGRELSRYFLSVIHPDLAYTHLSRSYGKHSYMSSCARIPSFTVTEIWLSKLYSGFQIPRNTGILSCGSKIGKFAIIRLRTGKPLEISIPLTGQKLSSNTEMIWLAQYSVRRQMNSWSGCWHLLSGWNILTVASNLLF
jgi:hypothetical protein